MASNTAVLISNETTFSEDENSGANIVALESIPAELANTESDSMKNIIEMNKEDVNKDNRSKQIMATDYVNATDDLCNKLITTASGNNIDSKSAESTVAELANNFPSIIDDVECVTDTAENQNQDIIDMNCCTEEELRPPFQTKYGSKFLTTEVEKSAADIIVTEIADQLSEVNGAKCAFDTQGITYEDIVMNCSHYREEPRSLLESDSDNDSDSTSSSTSVSSISSLSSVEEPVTKRENRKPNMSKAARTKTKGEIALEDLPRIEELNISVSETDIKEIGHISSIVDQLVIVESLRKSPALDLDSVLFISQEKPLGRIFDVFGPVIQPMYVVRFNTKEDIFEKNITEKQTVYFAPECNDITSFVFTESLMLQKGSDASWKHNNEPPDELIDYSDDEKERAARKKSHTKQHRKEVIEVTDNDNTPSPITHKNLSKAGSHINSNDTHKIKPPFNDRYKNRKITESSPRTDPIGYAQERSSKGFFRSSAIDHDSQNQYLISPKLNYHKRFLKVNNANSDTCDNPFKMKPLASTNLAVSETPCMKLPQSHVKMSRVCTPTLNASADGHSFMAFSQVTPRFAGPPNVSHSLLNHPSNNEPFSSFQGPSTTVLSGPSNNYNFLQSQTTTPPPVQQLASQTFSPTLNQQSYHSNVQHTFQSHQQHAFPSHVPQTFQTHVQPNFSPSPQPLPQQIYKPSLKQAFQPTSQQTFLPAPQQTFQQTTQPPQQTFQQTTQLPQQTFQQPPQQTLQQPPQQTFQQPPQQTFQQPPQHTFQQPPQQTFQQPPQQTFQQPPQQTFQQPPQQTFQQPPQHPLQQPPQHPLQQTFQQPPQQTFQQPPQQTLQQPPQQTLQQPPQQTLQQPPQQTLQQPPQQTLQQPPQQTLQQPPQQTLQQPPQQTFQLTPEQLPLQHSFSLSPQAFHSHTLHSQPHSLQPLQQWQPLLQPPQQQQHSLQPPQLQQHSLPSPQPQQNSLQQPQPQQHSLQPPQPQQHSLQPPQFQQHSLQPPQFQQHSSQPPHLQQHSLQPPQHSVQPPQHHLFHNKTSTASATQSPQQHSLQLPQQQRSLQSPHLQQHHLLQPYHH